MATTIGVVIGMLMWKEILLLAVVMGGAGRLLADDMSLWTLVAMILLPILAFVFGQPVEVIYASLGMSMLLLFKRITGNFERPVGEAYSIFMVLACRILWDRDVPDRKSWMSRNLPSEQDAELDPSVKENGA